MGTMVLVNLTVPQIKDWHRERKANQICYCMEEGESEYACKAKTSIDVEEGTSQYNCEVKVNGMTKPEILAYIKDDVVPHQEDNHGNFN